MCKGFSAQLLKHQPQGVLARKLTAGAGAAAYRCLRVGPVNRYPIRHLSTAGTFSPNQGPVRTAAQVGELTAPGELAAMIRCGRIGSLKQNELFTQFHKTTFFQVSGFPPQFAVQVQDQIDPRFTLILPHDKRKGNAEPAPTFIVPFLISGIWPLLAPDMSQAGHFSACRPPVLRFDSACFPPPSNLQCQTSCRWLSFFLAGNGQQIARF